MTAAQWTTGAVAARLEDAALTLHLLPPVRVNGYYNLWPPVIRSAFERMQADGKRPRLGPPAPDAITRMEKALEWLLWLDEEERRLVWMRAERVRWKVICRRLDVGRTKARDLWTAALLKICVRLNDAGMSGHNRGGHSGQLSLL